MFFIYPVTVSAQTFPVDAATGKIYYAEEVLVKDGPQLELYHRAKAWFAPIGKVKIVIKVDDLPNGVLIGQTYSPFSFTSPGKKQTYHLGYTLKLEIEDDRYWYSLTDFWLEPVIPLQAHSAKQVIGQQPLEIAVLPQKEKPVPNKVLAEAVQKTILAFIQNLKESLD
ncbi:DUF4468 domain-containing protein [Adhaeribacter pallidiroseus]|uniref:DUF4468 domain-containing protein n=1 Tax=Adhaeribacter pallidiroseus TaxID=2072847 RepID=UPI001314009B|nr:DUF4468 domain-containing protein [Adhaeribacter pallidiroseus]